ncbi:MAG: carboxypeptidase regulatory-like domain-containing protein, partial [Flavisolibacter sp.]
MRMDKTNNADPDQKSVGVGKDFRLYSKYIPVLLLICLPYFISAQNQKAIPNQQLRGTVVDQFLQTPIQGASITITGSGRTVISDAKGNFRFDTVAIGIHQLVISGI